MAGSFETDGRPKQFNDTGGDSQLPTHKVTADGVSPSLNADNNNGSQGRVIRFVRKRRNIRNTGPTQSGSLGAKHDLGQTSEPTSPNISERPKANIGEGNAQDIPIREAGEGSKFQFLAPKTAAFLESYLYKGVRTPELAAPNLRPGVLFLTADMKIPPSGEIKFLEFNGVGSSLRAYPEGGQQVAAHRIYQTLNALDLPIFAFAPPVDSLVALQNTLIGTDIGEAQRQKIRFVRHFEQYKNQSEENTHLDDLKDARGVIWRPYSSKLPPIDSQFAVVNPWDLESTLYSKIVFHELFTEAGVAHLRPQTWILPRESITESARLIEESSTETQKFILKPLGLSGGEGVVPIARGNLEQTVKHIFDDPYSVCDPYPGQSQEGWLRAANVRFLLEECIPSKPVVSTHDGNEYDATLRIAVIGIINQERMVLVPICSYWKLPTQPTSQPFEKRSIVSNVNGPNPSERVSHEDFERAFDSLAFCLPQVLNVLSQKHTDVNQ